MAVPKPTDWEKNRYKRSSIDEVGAWKTVNLEVKAYEKALSIENKKSHRKIAIME